VLFSALGEDGRGGFEPVVGAWTDADGDGAKPQNADVAPANDVWGLWTWNSAEGARRFRTLPGAGDAQPVQEWSRHQDFLGDDARLSWKQGSGAFGVEVFAPDLALVKGAALHHRGQRPRAGCASASNGTT
jgi:hypothetical protein